jgi:hypothetical protein
MCGAPSQCAFATALNSGLYELGNNIHKFHQEIVAVGTVALGIATLALYVATRNLVEGANDTAQRQLRAYISHQPLGADFWQGRLKYFEMNFGKTPAKDVQMFVGVKDGSEPPSDFKGPFERLEFMSYIAPGQNIGKIIPGHNNKPSLFLYGYVDYTDAFERKWRRRFAVSYDGSRAERGDDKWIWHAEHNDELERKKGSPCPT